MSFFYEWTPQISELASKLQRANGVLSKLCHFITWNP